MWCCGCVGWARLVCVACDICGWSAANPCIGPVGRIVTASSVALNQDSVLNPRLLPQPAARSAAGNCDFVAGWRRSRWDAIALKRYAYLPLTS